MRLATTCLLALYLITLPVSAADEEETPWYQVEVIIFSQQDLFEAEQPRTDIELGFPENWLHLIDPTKEQELEVQLQDQPEDQPRGKPKEQPFVMLDKDLQQLGPDHYTLRRAPGYRVLYHQAWRQPGADFNTAPWLIIQGGEQYDDHFELEGSIRLVKSRHLHIQANLWKTGFEPKQQLIQPAITEQTLMPGQEILQKQTISWPELPKVPLPPEPEIKPDETTATETTNSAVITAVNQKARFKNAPTRVEAARNYYQVKRIDKLEQSLKLSTEEVNYLDHPTMGVLVIVHPFKQEPPVIEGTSDDQPSSPTVPKQPSAGSSH